MSAGAGTVTSVVAGVGMSVDSSTPATPIVSGPTAASGQATLTYYVDNDNGSDSANCTTTATPCKTIDGVGAKVPPDGSGRALTINALPRASCATYKQANGTTDEALGILTRLTNYSLVTIRGNWYLTSSVPSNGGTTATGANAGGYDVSSISGSTITVTLHGGGAPGLAAEPDLLGYRWRWSESTATTALRNVTATVLGTTSTTITLDVTPTTTPSAGDFGYIEMPCFKIGTWNANSRVAFNLTGADHGGTTSSWYHPVTITFANRGAYSITNAINTTFTQVRTTGITVTGAQAVQAQGIYSTFGMEWIGVYRPLMTRFVLGSGGLFLENCGSPNMRPGTVVPGAQQYTVGDAPGATGFTNNATSRIINGNIVIAYSNVSIGRVRLDYDYGVITTPKFAVDFFGNGNTLLMDGVTASNYVSGLVDMAPPASAAIDPTRGNTIVFGATQTSITGGSQASADIHVGQISPLDGVSRVQYSLQLDTLTTTGTVTDGNGNSFTSYNSYGLGGVQVTHMLWDPDLNPPLGPTVANDQGRYRVVRSSTSSGLVVLASADSAANASNIVGVNIDSLPDPPATSYDRYGSALVVTDGVVPILTTDASPTVPGPVWLSQSGSHPLGLVTTTEPSSGAKVLVGYALADLGSHSQTTQYPLSPDPNTVTGKLLRVRLAAPMAVSATAPISGNGTPASPLTIADGAMSLAKLATQSDQTIMCNNTGGVASPLACTASQVRTVLGLAPVATSGSAADLSTGTLPAARMPSFSGDFTTSSGSTAATLATVNSDVGSFTNASITVNAKGLITAASSGSGSGAPTAATYITQTSDGTLSNEQALASLSTGILKNTTSTGVLSIATAGTDYESPLTFSTGLTRSTNTITSNLSTGVSGGQTAYGGTSTTENLTLRPNAADTTTGRAIVSGLGMQLPAGSSSVPSLNFGTSGTGFRGYSSAAVTFMSGGGDAVYMDSISVNTFSNAQSSGYYIGSAGQAYIVKDGAGTTGMNIGAGNAIRANVGTNGWRFYNTPFVSFASASSVRAQANGEVMAFAATPPNIASSAGAELNAYRWDAVTATFTGGTNITTSTGVNLVAIKRPTFTDSTSMTITNAATLVIENAPLAAGSLGITNGYSVWVQGGTARFDGGLDFRGAVVANGSVATAITSVGPAGASTTCQEWFVFKGTSGADRYVCGF